MSDRRPRTSGPSPSWASTTSSRSAARTPRWARWSATSPTSACDVPDGFATTADAYRRFIGDTGLAEEISGKLEGPRHRRHPALAEVGQEIREAVATQEFPEDLEADIRAAYDELVDGRDDVSFAVRSSATAEDLPDASFAGQQETFLNIKGIDGGAAGDPRGVRLALQRPGDRLPRAPRLRPRRRGALGRRAADGALRHRGLRRDVHDGHRVRASTTRCSSPRRTGWARGSCRAR